MTQGLLCYTVQTSDTGERKQEKNNKVSYLKTPGKRATPHPHLRPFLLSPALHPTPVRGRGEIWEGLEPPVLTAPMQG